MLDSENLENNSQVFYLDDKTTQPAQHIYDETYKNIKKKQKFEKDPKYSYFNAVMQMKRKLSNHQQVYRNVFEPSQQKNGEPIGSKTFYLNSSSYKSNQMSNGMRVEKIKSNSFKIYKDQSMDALIDKRNQSNNSKPINSLSRNNGRRSNFSYQNANGNVYSFEMIQKNQQKDSQGFLQFDIQQKVENQCPHRLLNPKPRLDDIMAEYRKMNRISNVRTKKSTLPKELSEKFYMTSRLFNNNRKN